MKCTLTLREVARSRTGPIWHSGPVMQYRVEGMQPGHLAMIANTRANEAPASWQILHVKDGVSSEWAGDYKTAEDALAAIQEEFGE